MGRRVFRPIEGVSLAVDFFPCMNVGLLSADKGRAKGVGLARGICDRDLPAGIRLFDGTPGDSFGALRAARPWPDMPTPDIKEKTSRKNVNLCLMSLYRPVFMVPSSVAGLPELQTTQ